MCALPFSLHNGESLTVEFFYKPPRSSDDVISKLSEALSSMLVYYLLFEGSFNSQNYNWGLDWPGHLDSVESNSVFLLISDFGPYQHVLLPTREGAIWVTTLHLIFTTKESLVASVVAIP